MLSEGRLRRALERVGLQAPVRYDEVTGSTQATGLELASAGTPEWTLVAAGHQTGGRGRLGRTWSDEPGRALMFSLVLRPDLDPEAGGLLTLLAGTAMVQACRELGADAACKWPNDVLVDGRKAAGILAESSVSDGRFEHVVLGIGANLGEPPPEVAGAGAVRADAADLLEAFLAAFERGYRPGDPGFAHAVTHAHAAVSATLGTRVRASVGDGAVIEGDAVAFDERGGLVVRTASGQRVVRFGEVEHLQ